MSRFWGVEIVKQQREDGLIGAGRNMLEQFEFAYDIHLWLRCLIWLGLMGAAVLLLWVSGGFPPRAWLLLMQVIPVVFTLWSVRGPMILLPLMALVVLALTWLVFWSLLLWSGIAIVFHWRHTQHEQLVAKSNWQSSRYHSHNPASNPPMNKQDKHSSFPSYGRGQPGPALATVMEPRPALCLNEGIGWDVGIRRKHKPNEDSLVTFRGTCTRNGQLVSFGLFIIADGMGGHDCGREASNLAIHCMLQSIVPNIFSSKQINGERLIEMLTDGAQWANQAIYQRNQEYGIGMGTTLTAALVLATMAYIVNVGDSRTYLYREGEGLTQITRDHSVVARLVEKGEIAPDEVYTHPDRNQVYRGLGSEGEVAVDWFAVPVRPGDYLILCSDGLWEMVRDREIERIVRRSGANPPQASATLVKAALQGGGVDNISVTVVQVAAASYDENPRVD